MIRCSDPGFETLAAGSLLNVHRLSSQSLYQPFRLDTSHSVGELIVYPLIGSGTLKVDNSDVEFSGRESVTQAPTPSLHINAFTTHTAVIDIRPTTASMDLIIAESHLQISGQPPLTRARPVPRNVGTDAYRRIVTDMQVPYETPLHIGETLNDPASWSSWPPHANPQEASTRFNEHEEYFLIITPSYGIMSLDGYYTDGAPVKDVLRVENNQFFQVPLGSHSIVFHPQNGPCWGWYLWVYNSFLRKTYNTQAHHVGTYVR